MLPNFSSLNLDDLVKGSRTKPEGNSGVSESKATKPDMVALLNKVKGASFTSSKSAFLQHSLSSKGTL